MPGPEQQVANTEPQETPQETPQGTEPQQVQSTVQKPQGQPQVTEPKPEVDLSKIDLSQATPEQLAEIQKGYMRNSDYTQKTQDLATERKEITDYDALIQKPEFIQWAADKQAQVQQPQTPEQEAEKLADMSEEDRIAHLVKKQLAPIAQSYYQDKQVTEDKELSTKYGESYKTFVPKITQMQQAIAKQPYLYREEAFKVLDYESVQKRAFEAGRQEGLKGIQQRQNANMQETTAPPTTQREIIRGPGAMQKIWERAEREGRGEARGTQSPE